MELLLVVLALALVVAVGYATVRLSERWSKPEDIQDLGPVSMGNESTEREVQ